MRRRDRRWPFSRSALLPPSGRFEHGLAIVLLALAIAAAAIPGSRGGRPLRQAGRAA